MSIPLANLHLVLARQLQRRFDRLRPTTGKVNRSTCKIFSGKIEQLLREFFRHRGRELAGMDKLQLPSLLRYGVGNFTKAMPNEVRRRRSREIQVAIALAIPHVNALAT